jgi:hypothetical protein
MRKVGFCDGDPVVLLGAIGGAYWLIGPMLDGRILPVCRSGECRWVELRLKKAASVLRELGWMCHGWLLLGPDGQRWISLPRTLE